MIELEKSLPVRRISPADAQYFFGYYDLQPFNKSGEYHLTHKTTFRDRLHVKGDIAELGVISSTTGKYEAVETTRTWCFQQGAMLQWNSLSPEDEIIYNDLLDGEGVGVVLNIKTGKKRYLDKPIANVSRDGKYGLCINMSRLYDFRPGYGYAEPLDRFYYKNHSTEDGVFLMDMETGKSKMILSLQEIWDFSGDFFATDQKININHITFNPDASRFLMLVRNFHEKGVRHNTAPITVNRDGSDMRLFMDNGIHSHYWWLNNEDILLFSDAKGLDCARGFLNNYIVSDKTGEGEIMADGYFVFDNHMSMSPEGRYMLTDSYTDPTSHTQPLMIYDFETNTCSYIGHFYQLPCNNTDLRCDLHPRWNRTGDKLTFDSTHEGFRGIYQIEFTDEVKKTLFNE